MHGWIEARSGFASLDISVPKQLREPTALSLRAPPGSSVSCVGIRGGIGHVHVSFEEELLSGHILYGILG